MILSIRSAVEADVEYTAERFVCGTTVRLSDEFVDPSSSSMNMDLNPYMSRLTNTMRSVEPAPSQPQVITVFIQQALQHSTHVFVRSNSIRLPLEMAYEGLFGVLHREPQYYTTDMDGDNYGVISDRLKALY
ncbi:unnamed protein product [Schistosoma mattheei]|uniref:Uncharacterized protein n=1 Tax=Schistosoma mattheei TaxID=31246 RepID=A0A183PS57_9TREM|nr:unnamed protein product [Schistosoma mattheei]